MLVWVITGEIVLTPAEARPVKVPVNLWLISGIISGVVALGLVSYFLVRKRMKAKDSG